MKIIYMIQALMLSCFLSISASVSAQSGMGRYQQLYVTGEVVTVSGVVISRQLIVPPGVKTQAVYLNLMTKEGPLQVQLGPESFLEKTAGRYDMGDKLEVSGAKIILEGKPLILAAEVRKRGQVIVFRNSSGVPVWSGQ